jgi:hypothetical protein
VRSDCPIHAPGRAVTCLSARMQLRASCLPRGETVLRRKDLDCHGSRRGRRLSVVSITH